MANADTLVAKLDDIGDAIRAKTGGTAKLTLDEMPPAIRGIETGGHIPLAVIRSTSPLFTGSPSSGDNPEIIRDMIERLDFSGVKSGYGMFQNLSVITSGGTTAPDFSKVTSSDLTTMSKMFYGFKWPESGVAETPARYGSLILTGFRTSSVTSFENAFKSAYADVIDLSSFDTSSATTMASMFDGATFNKLVIGSGWSYEKISNVAANYPTFPFEVKNENGVLYSAGARIPTAAHTYTPK